MFYIAIRHRNHNNDDGSSGVADKAELVPLVLGLVGLLVWLCLLMVLCVPRHRSPPVRAWLNRCCGLVADEDRQEHLVWDLDWASAGEFEHRDQLAIVGRARQFDSEHGPATCWRRRSGRWIDIACKPPPANP